MPNWKKIVVSGSDATLNSLFVANAITASTFSGSHVGPLTGTASWASNAVSASFASTASFVNTLNQNVIITGSLTVGATSAGTSENTLILGPSPAGGAGEGGQLLLQASGGLYISASMLDNFQNQTRLLKGTNTSSNAVVANWNMHTSQMALPAYTSVSSFPGTAVANLAVDSTGSIITVSTSGGSVFPYTGVASINGGLIVTGSITASGAIHAQANNAMYFRGGDDAELWDINVTNTIGVYGQQDQGVGSIKLGSGGGTISGRSGSIGIGTITPNSASLHVSGNVWATSFTGSLLGTATTASYVLQAVSASFATLSQTANTASYVLNAITASYILQAVSASFATLSQTANTASYVVTAQTASFVATAQTASYVLQAVSASFATSASQAVTAAFASNADLLDGAHLSILATTGSNTFIGNQTVTGSINQSGSFNINGTITATTLVVQTITASVEFLTGSTKFGDATNDTHQFTGSVSISGSLTVVGPTVASGSFTGSILGTASYANNADLLDGTHLDTLATTGSNTFRGNQIITGSLTLSSSAAVELNVIGNQVNTGSLTATQGFTGSLFGTSSWAISASWAPSVGGASFPYTGSAVITGSLVVTGSIIATAGLSGSFSGSYRGDGSGLTGITATSSPAGPDTSIQFRDGAATSGSGNFLFNKTTNTVTISGSVNQRLQLFGSGSTIFTITGSQGELFKVADTASGATLAIISSGSNNIYTFTTSSLVISGSVALDSGYISLDAINDPTPPTISGSLIYVKEIAGRMMPKWIGNDGVDTPFQSNMMFNNISIIAPGGGTTLTTLGCSVTNLGTVSHPVLASTNLKTQTRRASFTTAATAGSSGSVRVSNLECWRGNATGFGGFFVNCRFGLSGSLQTGMRSFFGLTDSVAAITLINPITDTTLNKVGMAISASTGNWFLINNVAGTAPTSTSLGPNFPVDTTTMYELILFSRPSGSSIDYRVTNLSSSFQTSGSLTTNIPASTTFLARYGWVTNNATAAAVAFDLSKFSLETDY